MPLYHVARLTVYAAEGMIGEKELAVMKGGSALPRTVFFALIVSGLPAAAMANSSWHWISATRPWDVLPLVILVTLLVEVSAVAGIAKAGPLWKVALVVLVVNLFSYLAPYVLGYEASSPVFGHFAAATEEGDFYAIGATYTFMTLLTEVPVVYNMFKKSVGSRKRLLITIVGGKKSIGRGHKNKAA